MERRIARFLLAALAVAAPHAAEAQLGIVAGVKNFEEDVLLDFDGLTPNSELVTGDPIAPGVVFGGSDDPASERARVVDVGGGDLELEQVSVGTLAVPSRIAFTFTAFATAAGAQVTPIANGAGSPGVSAHDAVGGLLGSFGIFADQVGETGFFGFSGGVLPATGILALVYGPTSATADSMRFRVDDLAFAPEPAGGAGAAGASAALAALARLRRRAR